MTTLQLPVPEVPMTATSFVESIAGVDRFKREDMALDALLAGHVPSYMREFVPVTLTFADTTGKSHTLVINVLPDHLIVGTDDDRLRIPLFPLTAQKVADAWNCVLPTTKLVTLVWNAAPSKVPPQPWGPPYDATMTSTDRIVAHNKRVEDNIVRLGIDATRLMSGHKKDVTLTNRLVTQPDRVAIFGWMQPNGRPIQPLSLVHEATYADYSHGIRLISRECLVDSQPDDLTRVLQDPKLSVSISDEGPLKLVRQPGV